MSNKFKRQGIKRTTAQRLETLERTVLSNFRELRQQRANFDELVRIMTEIDPTLGESIDEQRKKVEKQEKKQKQ